MRTDSTLFSERAITTGVRQGIVSGPLLSSVYVNVAPKLLETRLAMFTDNRPVYAVDLSAEAVSYTHLDVYKRQLYITM